MTKSSQECVEEDLGVSDRTHSISDWYLSSAHADVDHSCYDDGGFYIVSQKRGNGMENF